MSMGVSLSGEERIFLGEAVSLSIDAYNATPDPSRITLLTNEVFKALGWPWNKTTALSITNELERKGLIDFLPQTTPGGKFHVTDYGLKIVGRY